MMQRLNVALGLALLVAFVTVLPASAQAPPLNAKTGGGLVGDMSLDQIYLTQDLNGDGDGDDPGESWVYFDGTNLSGLPAPTGAVYSLFQSVSGYQFFGDGTTDTIYRMRDLNGNWNALDTGEANVWFSDLGNFHGFHITSPNGVFQDSAGATYIFNTGTVSLPYDAIYRTVDLNADGDANDENEATLWMDVQTLIPDSSAFGLTIMNDVVYFADLVGGNPDTVFRAEDVNGNGTIEAGEFNVFIDANNPYGVEVGAAVVTDGTSIFLSESSGANEVTRLTDLNGNGVIDDAAEAIEVWNESLVPPGFEMGASWSLAIGPGGELLMGSSGTDLRDNVFRLLDLNGDGDFLDAGETIAWASGHGSGIFVDSARSVEYMIPEPGTLSLLALAALALIRRR